MAGVHVVMVDEWGNRSDTVSKNGEADYGSYDFAIHSFANHYTLTVVDPAGNIASPAVTVEHLQGAGAMRRVIRWCGSADEKPNHGDHGDTENAGFSGKLSVLSVPLW